MILFFSLTIDIVLLILTIKNKSVTKALRFLSYAAIINLLAYYMTCGLYEAFMQSILIDIVCAVTAKIFVIYMYSLFTKDEKFQKPSVYLLVIAVSVCVHANSITGIVCEIILLAFLLYSVRAGKTDEKDNDAVKSNENSPYLRTIEENYRKLREIWHDLNNHILCMRSLAENRRYDELESYINLLSDKVSDNIFPVKSGNIILDALIADKYQKARKSGIYIEFEAVNYNAALDEGDLCTVLGNLFDNAIEENVRSKNNDNRYIKLYISSADDKVTIRLKNPLCHELTLKDGLPSTVKPDVTHHGIGLKNVRRICDKYNGELVWITENSMFEITARLILTSNP